jgi:hypothetical protein
VVVVLYPVHFNILNLLLNSSLPTSVFGNFAIIRVDKATFCLHSRRHSVRPADWQRRCSEPDSFSVRYDGVRRLW